MNYQVFRDLNSLAIHGGAAFDEFWRIAANDFVLLFPLALVLLWIVPGRNAHRVRTGAVITAGGVLLGLLFNQILGRIVIEARPFVSHHVDQLVAHAADNSFPSDHATVAFAVVAGVAVVRRDWAAVLTIFAIVVGLARVVAGLHYPGDILAGAGTGILGSVLVWLLLRRPLDRLTAFGEAIYERIVEPVRRAVGGRGRHRAGV